MIEMQVGDDDGIGPGEPFRFRWGHVPREMCKSTPEQWVCENACSIHFDHKSGVTEVPDAGRIAHHGRRPRTEVTSSAPVMPVTVEKAPTP